MSCFVQDEWTCLHNKLICQDDIHVSVCRSAVKELYWASDTIFVQLLIYWPFSSIYALQARIQCVTHALSGHVRNDQMSSPTPEILNALNTSHRSIFCKDVWEIWIWYLCEHIGIYCHSTCRGGSVATAFCWARGRTFDSKVWWLHFNWGDMQKNLFT